MARSSQEAQDAIIWQTVGLPLGMAGLDLRQPSDPRALAKLLNARFKDERTVERRNGYDGVLIQDGSDFPQALDEDDNGISLPMATDGWVYGHGQMLLQTAQTRETDHFPIAGTARGVFELDGADVVWTGDRLLVVRRDGMPALGQSEFWGTTTDTAPFAYGIPAYLPVQTDNAAPAAVPSDYVETCLTETVRCVVAVTGETLTAWILNRTTGTLINESILGGDSDPVNPRVFQSGAYIVCVWRDSVTTTLYYSYWSGTQWSLAASISTGVGAFEVAVVPGGFHLLRRETSTLKLTRYGGKALSTTPYAVNTTLSVSGGNPDGDVAIAAAPNGDLCVVWQAADGLKAKVYNSSLSAGTQATLDATVTTWDGGITVCSRLLTPNVDTVDKYPFVVHAGTTFDPDGTVTRFWEFRNNNPASVIRSDERWNALVATKSFRVGNEVFCWLRSDNSATLFLVAGAYKPQVCGIADREEGLERTALSQITQDPLDEYTFTWARPYNTGNEYSHAGNARIGDINFMPRLSTAQYGKSVYLGGSHVRNWDGGDELGDAGFHDYPIVTAHSSDAVGGSLTASGVYQVRVYPVRYNKRGERFQGVALTYTTGALSGGHNRIGWNIPTIACTNHDDVIFEVYRTEAGGTTFYLDGTVANDLTVPSVVYYSTMSDVALAQGGRVADPHETGVAAADEMEEMGPLGCAILTSSEDRLWGAGGQVPRGQVQFSKLKEPKEGAGFDSLAGYQEIDIQGGEITSIVGYGDSTVVFQRNGFYALGGNGPDNYGAGGGFGTPDLRLVDGAVNHAGTAVVSVGIAYWGVDGPRLIHPNMSVEVISAPVRALTKTLTPTGVQADLARQEVVWFTEDGTAVLWNYQNGNRWAKWVGLKVAGATDQSLVTTDGRLLVESADAYGDAGVPFEFAGSSGELMTAQMFGAHVEVNSVGIVGKYEGPHNLRVKVFYNGSPLWSDRWEWEPTNNTWLTSGDDHADLTPAEIDALKPSSKAGSYATHKKVNRHNCRHFRVEWTDIGSDRPTYQPHELSLEIGSRGGLGRVPVNSFGS